VGEPGSEVASIAEAFAVAGGDSVLASLWSVSDEGTEALMDEFYRQVAAGNSLARALQEAERSALARKELAHPYYWAAFALFGDWR
jgi:CHAT domain-containing protein